MMVYWLGKLHVNKLNDHCLAELYITGYRGNAEIENFDIEMGRKTFFYI